MELDALDRQRFVPHAHDLAVIERSRRDDEALRQRFALHHERMVAHALERVRHALEHTLAVMLDGRSLAVHDAFGLSNDATGHVRGCLVPQTDAEYGDGSAIEHELPIECGAQDIEAHARSLRCAGSGREHDSPWPQSQDLVEGDAVVTAHDRLRPALSQVLHEVVREAVVIVYDEQHTSNYVRLATVIMDVMTLRFLVALGLGAAAWFAPQDLSTPERAARKLAAAITANNFVEAAQCVRGANPKADYSAFIRASQRAPYGVRVLSTKARIRGSRAMLTVKVEFYAKKTHDRQTTTETVHLQRTRGAWQFVPSFDFGELGLFGRMIANIAKPNRTDEIQLAANRAAESCRRLKELAEATLRFAASHNDTIATTAAKWRHDIGVLLKDQATFTAPGVKPGTQSFQLNDAVAGLKITGKTPLDTVMLYEGKHRRLDFRYEGRGVVAFMDGTARVVTKSEAANLRWKP